MIRIDRDIDVARITTFGIHAKAAAIAHYNTTEDLIGILSDSSLPRPLKHIGSGSNLLFTGDFPGTLIHCSERAAFFTRPDLNGEILATASAGFVMDKLCLVAADKGYWGLENLSGIPGEVGASAVQNVGAYGVEAGDLIRMVRTLDTSTLEERSFSQHELDFAYRDSFFKHPENRGRYIVTEVTFALSTEAAPNLDYAHLDSLVRERCGEHITPMAVREAVISMRDAKLPDPSVIGSAGSFFKNPVVDRRVYEQICIDNPGETVPHFDLLDNMVKIPAAWLIDRAGFKGRRIGGAEVWSKQPLVIVNMTGNATGTDVVSLEMAIKTEVNLRFGIDLNPEVEHL